MNDYLIVDLEMCNINRKWKSNGVLLHKEIIQIGAVLVDENYRILDTFSTYVRPQHGKIDRIILNLTGIRPSMVKNAPLLGEAVGKMCRFIGSRHVTILSWSDNDYRQMAQEMRAKHLINRRMEKMMEEWTDLQKSFGAMFCEDKQMSLYDALEISGLEPKGPIHDGLWDAFNTARLFCRIFQQDRFEPVLIPIKRDHGQTPGRQKTGWGYRRILHRLLHGREAATDSAWNKYLYSQELDKKEFHEFPEPR